MAVCQVYLDICMGDSKKFLRDRDAYDRARSHLDRHAASYGLPSKPEELSDWQREIIQGIDAPLGHETPLLFEPPEPLLAGRLVFELSVSPKLAKTTTNFVALCTGEKGPCKSASNKKLHYLECPVHRIVKGFIAQGGDILRGDGSGGESIYGGDFKAEEEGLKVMPRKGSLGMASSKTGSGARNTSQFFVVLTDDEAQLKKLKGQYVIFGQLKGGEAESRVLDRLSGAGGGNEKPLIPVWIGGCGTCPSG
ncbi:cyclophilin-like domain-containing protein [Boletus edulis]|nr:cyclophilin-like domain-containing protein [Boletus edulis]